jgi:FkbM family methyltransferase
MIYKLARRVVRKVRRTLWPENGFLRHIDTLVHVGANEGQERELYATFDLNVHWIEPIPEVFEQLRAALQSFPKQKAYKALILDRDGNARILHVASNNGASSSIFDLGEHRQLWPEISFTHDISVESTTLTSLVRKQSINLGKNAALILDTQGSELLVLEGAMDLLPRFKYVKTEVADFDSYFGCCKLSDLLPFMKQHGFQEVRRDAFKTSPGIGTYYDILFRQARRRSGGQTAERNPGRHNSSSVTAVSHCSPLHE